MKFRQQFVSNSSSCSFIIVIDEKAHQDILTEVDDDVRKLFQELNIESKKVGNENIILISANFSTEGDGNYINGKYFPASTAEEYDELYTKFVDYYNLAAKTKAILTSDHH